MTIESFDARWFKQSKTLIGDGSKYSAGQVTIIGGSRLFHGAPILALKGSSRMVSMVYFATPDYDKDIAERIKAGLGSFIWVSLADLSGYIEKSDAVLIGPGLMRSHESEHNSACDDEGSKTRELTLGLVTAFPQKNWLVDGGSLQVVEVTELPKGAAVSPNKKEFEMLFGESLETELSKRAEQQKRLAKKHGLVILTKDATSLVSDGERVVAIEGGNEGLVKGGVGDVIAGVALGFMAKNDALFALCAASYLVKKAAEKLASEKGLMFNADDLVEMVPAIFGQTTKDL